MKFIFSPFLFFTVMIVAGQTNVNTAIKRIDTIHSKILNEDRYIWVHIPESAKGSFERYPVIYLLDGEMHFDEVNDILNRLSKETGQPIFKEMIVVSIGNIWQRYRDYSPTHVASSPWLDSYSASISGGGDKFISFLEKELLPYINATYPVSPVRILIGHSMGGLITTDILLKHTNMFNYYAVIDPSMWWDDMKLLNESKIILAKKTFDKSSLFLAVANTKELDMDVAKIRTNAGDAGRLIGPSLELVDNVKASKQNNLKFEWKFYKDHYHMTVPPVAIYDALKFFLNFL